MACDTAVAIEFKTAFVGYGEVLEPVNGKIAVDVGNRLGPGVIDHHQPGAPDACAAALVVRHPEYVLDHLGRMPIEEVTLVTHVSPDLDAVAAAWLCRNLMMRGRLSSRESVIADDVGDVDRGICFRRSGAVVTVYSIFMALCRLIDDNSAVGKDPSDKKTNRRRLSCGFSLQYSWPP